MSGRSVDPRIAILLHTLDSAYLRRGWHGPVLRNVLKDLPARVARRRAVRGRHSIWELALHTAYWKYIVLRRITGDEALTFPREGANFPAVPTHGGEKEWQADLRLLDATHRQLRAAVAGFAAARLGRKRPRGQWTYAEEIQGAAAHDLYHAGQMMMLRRMQGE